MMSCKQIQNKAHKKIRISLCRCVVWNVLERSLFVMTRVKKKSAHQSAEKKRK